MSFSLLPSSPGGLALRCPYITRFVIKAKSNRIKIFNNLFQVCYIGNYLVQTCVNVSLMLFSLFPSPRHPIPPTQLLNMLRLRVLVLRGLKKLRILFLYVFSSLSFSRDLSLMADIPHPSPHNKSEAIAGSREFHSAVNKGQAHPQLMDPGRYRL